MRILRSTILIVFHKNQNSKKSHDWKLWVLETNLLLVISGNCEQSLMTQGQMRLEICSKFAVNCLL